MKGQKKMILLLGILMVCSITLQACKEDEEFRTDLLLSDSNWTEISENTNNNLNYQVKIRNIDSLEWRNLVVDSAKVNNRGHIGYSSFVTFDNDFNSPVEVEVVPLRSGNVRIRPSSCRLVPRTEDGRIRFTLEKPEKISLEIEEDIVENLMIFANSTISEVPDLTNPNVIYYGPGEHTVGEIILTDNQTLFLAEGATVYGHILARNANNIRIVGRGILDGSLLEHRLGEHRVYFIHLENCSDVLVEGIIIRDAPGWGCVPWGCRDIVFRNVKQISYNYNSDGFDICHSRNVLIEDVFLRNWDDNISIKSLNGSNVYEITMRNSILWADNAHNMLVGPEMRGGTAKTIRFENIDVLENTQNDEVYPGVMSIMAADRGKFEDITFENIRVENISAGKVICLQYVNVYSENGQGEYVKDVMFKNIIYNGTHASKNRIFGLNNLQTVENILIENFFLNGQKALDPLSGNFKLNPYVVNLIFE